ncbi:UTRA domain-containing protein [Kribbella italica]|uniref:DNA-binding GntR family transcriptional regulator n=1 Tax=Kribbella italica TaxID=1540520 RepID=A0A7W9MTZ3_9ACTN|nr:DNA-binding GntR family transcriptional regulator [Kribbella italica]
MPRSKFREIAEQLADEIAALPAGTRIETEHEIAERFGVGRAAARAALQDLQHRMLVRRVQGVGTFTSRRIDYLISPNRVPSWSQTVRSAGSRPRTVVRSCELMPLPDELADLLGRPRGTACHLLRRRSFTDDVPAAWGAEWVPVDVVPELPVAVRLVESLDTILRDVAGAVPTRAWSRAAMEAVDRSVAGELGCKTGDWAWLVESLNVDALSGRPLCYTQRWMRADTVRVVIESSDRLEISRPDRSTDRSPDPLGE